MKSIRLVLLWHQEVVSLYCLLILLSQLNLSANIFLARCRVLLFNYGRIHPAQRGLVKKLLEIGQLLQIHGTDSLRLIYFHAQRDNLFYLS